MGADNKLFHYIRNVNSNMESFKWKANPSDLPICDEKVDVLNICSNNEQPNFLKSIINPKIKDRAFDTVNQANTTSVFDYKTNSKIMQFSKSLNQNI